jgi:hypothetical protein
MDHQEMTGGVVRADAATDGRFGLLRAVVILSAQVTKEGAPNKTHWIRGCPITSSCVGNGQSVALQRGRQRLQCATNGCEALPKRCVRERKGRPRFCAAQPVEDEDGHLAGGSWHGRQHEVHGRRRACFHRPLGLETVSGGRRALGVTESSLPSLASRRRPCVQRTSVADYSGEPGAVGLDVEIQASILDRHEERIVKEVFRLSSNACVLSGQTEPKPVVVKGHGRSRVRRIFPFTHVGW